MTQDGHCVCGVAVVGYLCVLYRFWARFPLKLGQFLSVRKLGIFSFNLIQIISAIYVMTYICMCV
jgi:hypothetical protein